MPYPMEDEEPQVTFTTSWGTQPSAEAFTEMLKDCERMVSGQHEGGVSAYESGTALEMLREQEHGATVRNMAAVVRQKEAILRGQGGFERFIMVRWLLPADAPSIPFRTITSIKTPKPDTRCLKVDADTGVRCMHEAGTSHAHETPAGKPIFSEHAGPKIGERRVTGFGVTLDLPIPPGPVEKLLLRAEAALQRNPFVRRNWPKGDWPAPFHSTPAGRAAADRGAGAHLAALHQDTLNRPFYKGKRVRP